MEKLLVLELDGTFKQGFRVKLEIRKDIYSRPQTLVRAGLPANSELLDIYQEWQRLYSDLENFFRALKDSDTDQITRSSDREDAIKNCQKMATLVEEKLNDWLNSSLEFELIRKALLQAGNNFCIWLQTDNVWLQRLPFEKWDLLQETRANIAIIAFEYDVSERLFNLNNNIKILAILGWVPDLYFLQEERRILDKIAEKAGAEIVWKDAPKPQDLNQLLRQDSWDILFFSGHSASTEDGKRFLIQLTEKDILEIPDFRFALGEATKKGLKLAIFNSCDGIGLAHQLAAERGMALPHLIFMREKLPDPVSPKFLQSFLEFFTANHSLYTSVQEARNILHDDWEKQYPCASWLPVICPNPTEDPPTWNSLSLATKKQQNRWLFNAALTISLLVAGLVVGVRESGSLESWELNTYDRIMRLKPQDKSDDRFLIITIDKEDKVYQDKMGMKRAKITNPTDLPKYSDGKRSLAGEALSRLLSKLKPYKPSIIALDILRPISAEQDYPPLGHQLKTTPNLIAICNFNNFGERNGFPPPPELPENQVGYNNVIPDGYSARIPKIRRFLYQARLDKTSPCLPSKSLAESSSISCEFTNYAPSFSLIIAKRYLESQNKDFDCKKLDRGILEINTGDTSIGDWLQSANGPYKLRPKDAEAGRQVMLDYRRISSENGISAITKIAPVKSLRQVLNPSFNLDSVKGKIILIGVIELNADDFLTPFSRDESEVIPGVYLHAHAVSQILDTMLGQRVSIKIWTPWQEAFWIFGWSIVGGVLAWRFLTFKHLTIAGVIALVTLSGVCLILFNWGGLWVPLIPSVLGLIMTFGIFMIVRSLYLQDLRR